MKHPSRRFSDKASSLVRYFCTARMQAEAEVAPVGRDGLFHRRLAVLRVTGGTVAQMLNQYNRDDKIDQKNELHSYIKYLCNYGKFHYALEVMERMELRDIDYSHPDCAICLDLISKANGLSAAENYFSGLPITSKEQIYLWSSTKLLLQRKTGGQSTGSL